jgi:hypothetical protein
MGCCGQKRSQPQGAVSSALRPASPVPAVRGLNSPTRPALGGAGAALPGASAGGRGVVLRYREPGRVLVRGPVTGRGYEFSAEQPTQAVEARDAEALLRSRRFVRVEGLLAR